MTEKKRRVRIVRDDCAENPRKDDNLSTMVCWHGRYTLGDDQPSIGSREWSIGLACELCPRLGAIIDNWENGGSFDWLHEVSGSTDVNNTQRTISNHINNMVLAVLEENTVSCKLYLYDHSGISIACEPFSCMWDSMQVGIAYVTKERVIKEYCEWTEETRKKAMECIKAEVKIYDLYLGGEVYSFIVEEWQGCATCGHGEWEVVDSCGGFYGSDPEMNDMKDHLSEEDFALIGKEE
jgi:hypothetical protein